MRHLINRTLDRIYAEDVSELDSCIQERNKHLIEIYNQDCMETMREMQKKSIDVVLTSPFYNTNKKAGQTRNLDNSAMNDGRYEYIRYDTHVDNMTNEEYDDFTVKLFDSFDEVLKENGVILYNINYGSENTDNMFTAISAVISKTNFSIADVIVWKKSNAFPNSCSPNKLTRIWEFVFVLCRKKELKTFKSNKQIKSYRKTGQPAYENITNFIEAKNNDESCPYNKATFSTDLCKKLLSLYAPYSATVYDPFCGSGTTAVACDEMGFDFIGSEISEKQVEWSKQRLLRTQNNLSKNNWLDELLGGEQDGEL